MALIYGVLGWARAGRLRRAAARRAPAGADRGLGRRRRGVRALAAGAGRPARGSRVLRRGARRSRSTRRSRAGSSRPSASCGCSSPAAVACVLAPELVYVRDEFDGSALYRMNTVFKLGYQAFLLLAIAAACALPWAGRWLPRRAVGGLGRGRRGAAAARARVPVRGQLGAARRLLAQPDARRARLAARERARRRRGDRRGCARTRPATPSLLEAAGPDYSGFGHARMSTFTGPPDRDRLGRARAAVEARPGPPRRRRARDVHGHGRRTPRARCSTATGSATSSSARSSAPTTATPGSPSGTRSGGGCSTATARRSGTWRRTSTALGREVREPARSPAPHVERRVVPHG